MSLADALRAALPTHSKDMVSTTPLTPGFKGKLRYIHTPSKPCEPLFSPPPGQEPERTRLSSHFLTLSIHPLQTVGGHGKIDDRLANHEEGVLGIGVEIYVYTTRHLTTIFVSKADTTGYLPSHPPSRTKIICTTFIQWLVEQHRSKHPHRKVVVSLFARAQAQYLFPGSVEHSGKHVLDDRQLIKWWAKVLNPLLDLKSHSEDRPDINAYLTIPGHDATELRSYFPIPSARGWHAGTPLKVLATTRGVAADAPPRSLLPRFPDDPKARFMQDLDDEVGIAEPSSISISPLKRKSGRWKNVRDLDRFWEAMEFRQECASGRVVGFIWVVIAPKTDAAVDSESGQGNEGGSQEREWTPTPPSASQSRPSKRHHRRRKQLTGPIVPRQPRLKGGSSSLTAASSDLASMVNGPAQDGALLLTKEGYDKAIQTLLNLDFANLPVAAKSTVKWVQEVGGLCGLSGDWGVDVAGTKEFPQISVAGKEGDAKAAEEGKKDGEVNDLGGMVRKKRKVDDGADGGQRREGGNGVNVLGLGMLRKKPKAAS